MITHSAHAREGPRSQVPRSGILRSARCRPGQVRDAAPRFDRQRARKRCRQRIRGLKADLLPSQGELRRGRHCRVGSQEARPTGSVQGPGRSTGVPPGTRRPRRTGSCPRVGAVDTARVQPRCAPKDDRACGQWKKNAALVAETAAECLPWLSAIVAEYETLRMATLGDALPPVSRSGLALFLSRGMWGWARMLTTANRCPTPLLAAPSGPTERCSRNAIIQVLAAIVMNFDRRRTP